MRVNVMRHQNEEFHEEVFHVKIQANNSANIEVSINQQRTKALIDSGSSCNIISMRTYRSLGGSKAQIRPSKAKVYAFCAEIPLPVVGEAEMDVQANGRCQRAIFILIRKQGGTILGRGTSKQLDMLRIGPPVDTEAQVASLAVKSPNDQHLPKQLRLDPLHVI